MIIKTIASSSKGNCYSIQDGPNGTRILIECGIPIKKIQGGLNYELSNYFGCLSTHAHFDHILAHKDIIKHGIPIYWSKGTADALGYDKPHYLSRIVKHGQQFEIGTLKIVPFDVKHDAPEPLGFLIQGNTGKLLFATDTYYIPHRFTSLTHVMIEANYEKDEINEKNCCKALRDRLYNSHMEFKTVCSFFKELDRSKLQEVHLLHLSEERSDSEKFRAEIMKITGVPVYV